jgi:hypothetical protein
VRRAALAAAVMLTLARSASGQEVQAQVDARKPGVEDQVQLTLTISGAGELREEPVVPQLENLRAVGGPFTSQQFSFVNGRTSQTVGYTWVLRPVAPGPARVGAITVKLVGGDKTTAPIDLEIVAGSQRPQRPQRSDPFEEALGDMFGRRERGPRQEPKLRVEASLSRTRLHVGEPLVVTYSVLTTVSIADVQFKEPPQYPGFWAEELERPDSPPGGEPVTIDGQAYRRFPLLRKLLFPTRAGTLTIPAATLRLGLARSSFFDAGGVAERGTQPVNVTVDAIPTSAAFSGAVGDFKPSAALDKDALAFGEAATLRFQVEGRGNLKWIERGPDVVIPGAKVYPPQVRSALKTTAGGLVGTKTWEYVVVPETAGALEVPPLEFTWFDPRAARLAQARTAALSLRVGEATAGAPPPPAAASGGAPRAASAGPALRSDLDLATGAWPSLGARALLGLVALALLGHAALAGGARLAEGRRLRAGRPASGRAARQALGELRRAARGDMSKEAAAALIDKALGEAFGASDEDAGEPRDERERTLRALRQEVQFIRYAPQLGDYSEKIRDVAARAEEALRRWA